MANLKVDGVELVEGAPVLIAGGVLEDGFPANPSVGDMYQPLDVNAVYFFNGSVWDILSPYIPDATQALKNFKGELIKPKSTDYNGMKIMSDHSLGKAHFQWDENAGMLNYEVTGRQAYVIDGEWKEFGHIVKVTKEFAEDNGTQQIEDEMSVMIAEHAQLEISKSIDMMVGDMITNSTFGQPTPKDMVAAVFKAVKHELRDKIETDSDIDIEKELEEVGAYMIGALIKRCKNVSVDKDIAHMKYRVILDVTFDYGELEQWLSQ